MLPNEDDDVISVDTATTIEVQDEDAEQDEDVPPLVEVHPIDQNNYMDDLPALIYIYSILQPFPLELPAYEESEDDQLDRVWDLLNHCVTLEPIERHFESDFSDYVSGEDFEHNETAYQLDDCDAHPLKFSTLQTMIQDHRQYKNPRTRTAIMYFTKIRVLKI